MVCPWGRGMCQARGSGGSGPRFLCGWKALHQGQIVVLPEMACIHSPLGLQGLRVREINHCHAGCAL